jgi:excisionase family DNA binding protein
MTEPTRTTLTLTEAAHGLGVQPATLRAQIARGRLAAERRGRDWHITPAEYDRYKSQVQLSRPSRSSALDETVRAIGEAFERTAEWPQTRSLQRELVLRGFGVDLVEVGGRLDPSLGRIDRAGAAVLNIRGLIRARASESVADFELAMRLAIARYHDASINEPKIGSADFRAEGLSVLRVRRLLETLRTNPLVTGSGGGTDEEWAYGVSDDVHLLGRVRTAEGYLAVLDHLTSPHGILDPGPRSTDWPEVEARLRELGPLLERAETLDDMQDIGRRCREIVSDLADVALAAAVPPISAAPFGSDRKAKLAAFLAQTAAGPSGEELRRLVTATFNLANTVTHSTRGSRSDAVAGAQATVLLVRTLRELAHEQGRR